MIRHRSDSKRRSERRQHTRYRVQYSVTVERESMKESLNGALLDVSGGGLLLFLSRTLPVGERVGVRLDSPGAVFSLPGRIIWGGQRQGLSHVHGIEFERPQDRRFARHLHEMAHELW
jgi:hypothetical protein